MRSIPIDFDAATYQRAIDACGGTEEALWLEYYRELGGLVRGARARVVGHVDLVRLFSGEEGRDLRVCWGGRVWEAVVAVLREVRRGGGWLECNTSGLRKGLGEPYPGRVVAEVSLFKGEGKGEKG